MYQQLKLLTLISVGFSCVSIPVEYADAEPGPALSWKKVVIEVPIDYGGKPSITWELTDQKQMKQLDRFLVRIKNRWKRPMFSSGLGVRAFVEVKGGRGTRLLWLGVPQHGHFISKQDPKGIYFYDNNLEAQLSEGEYNLLLSLLQISSWPKN